MSYSNLGGGQYPQTALSGNYPVDIAAPQKESPLSEQLNGLVSGIAEVEQNLSILENRLAPVMMPPIPAGQTNGAPTSPSSHGPVVDAIRESNRRLASVSAHVRYLIDKLAV